MRSTRCVLASSSVAIGLIDEELIESSNESNDPPLSEEASSNPSQVRFEDDLVVGRGRLGGYIAVSTIELLTGRMM